MSSGEYRAWFKSEQRARLAACFLTYAAGLLFISQILQTVTSFQIFSFSLKNLGYTALLVVAQVILLAAQCMILSVEPRTEPWLMRIKFYLTSPMHLLVGLLFPLSAIAACRSLLELTRFEISPLGLATLDHNRVCAFGAIFSFGVWSAVKYLGRQDMLIVFPSLQQSRWIRIQACLPRLVSTAARNAAKFIAVWYVVYWLLSLAFPDLLPYLVRVTVSPILGPQSFELSASVSFGKGIVVFLALFIVELCWKVGELLLMIFSTEIVLFDQFLLFGLTDLDRMAKYQAFQCLLETAELSPKAREGLYDRAPYYVPVDKNSSWRVISQQSVQILNNFVDSLCTDLTKPAPLGKGWLFRNHSQRVAFLFQDLQLACWSAQILSYLVAFSLEEDEKGCVQQSLPSIFAALLDCSIAIEELERVTKPFSSQPQPIVLSQTLDNCIYRIVTTFYDQLDNLALSDRHAKRLREYTQFSR